MSGKVLTLVPAEKPAQVCEVLEEAMKADLTEVVVFGFCRDGSEHFGATGSRMEAHWLLARGARWVMKAVDDEGEPA